VYSNAEKNEATLRNAREATDFGMKVLSHLQGVHKFNLSFNTFLDQAIYNFDTCTLRWYDFFWSLGQELTVPLPKQEDVNVTAEMWKEDYMIRDTRNKWLGHFDFGEDDI
jgi:hypothetical protein